VSPLSKARVSAHERSPRRRASSVWATPQSGWAYRILVGLREDRDGRPWAVCDVDGDRVIASANGVAADKIGRAVHLIYFRIDADGSLREVRVFLVGPHERLSAQHALRRSSRS
jgi:hypothetical protein